MEKETSVNDPDEKSEREGQLKTREERRGERRTCVDDSETVGVSSFQCRIPVLCGEVRSAVCAAGVLREG